MPRRALVSGLKLRTLRVGANQHHVRERVEAAFAPRSRGACLYVHPICAIFPPQRRRIVPRPQACGAKNALAKDVPAKSGAEGSDESILKKDLAAAEAPDDQADDTVDSDLAKAMFAAHEPSPNAVFFAAKTGAEASVDETGVIKNGPALKPVTKVATALKPAAAGGAPLSMIKEVPEENPAPAASALLLRLGPTP